MIGYGNQAPVTRDGRLVCIFYSLFGIPINGLLIATIAGFFTTQVRCFDNNDWSRKSTTIGRSWWISGMVGLGLRPRCGTDGLKDVRIFQFKRFRQNRPQESSPKNPNSFGRKVLLGFHVFAYLIPGIAFFIMLPSVAFFHLEDKWTFVDCIYFSFITLSTVGFGDLVAGTTFKSQLFIEVNSFNLFTSLLSSIPEFPFSRTRLEWRPVERQFEDRLRGLRYRVDHFRSGLHIHAHQLGGRSLHLIRQNSQEKPSASGQTAHFYCSQWGMEICNVFSSFCDRSLFPDEISKFVTNFPTSFYFATDLSDMISKVNLCQKTTSNL